jgi:hypothetical protein
MLLSDAAAVDVESPCAVDGERSRHCLVGYVEWLAREDGRLVGGLESRASPRSLPVLIAKVEALGYSGAICPDDLVTNLEARVLSGRSESVNRAGAAEREEVTPRL